MSGICDTCRRTRPCPNEGEGLRFCAFREHGETRWERLFGTPERAAKTVANIACDDGGCEGCSLYGANCSYDSDVLLEWLRGDA